MGLHTDYKPMGFGRNLPVSDGPKTTPSINLDAPKPSEPKIVEVKAETKPPVQQKPQEKKPEPKSTKPEPKEEPKPEPEKEDDGWHVVEAKRPKKKKN